MIEIKNITKEYIDELGMNQTSLNNVSFNIPDGKITAVIAPECSAKSMLLKIISGLDFPTGGNIVNGSKGPVIYIPSLPSSFPWLNVEQNVMAGNKSTSNLEINLLINMVGLEGYEKYRPHNSSAGFRFRISLARALRQNPSLIILDDPFKVMEPESRKEIYQLVKRINQTFKTTFLLASYDISEAIALSDIILLMKKNSVKIVPIQIPDIPLFEKNSDSFGSEEFLKIKNQIEYFIANIDLNQ